MFEIFTDGDVMNASYEGRSHVFQCNSDNQWAPPQPLTFISKNIFKTILSAIKRVFFDFDPGDLTLERLSSLAYASCVFVFEN